MIEAGVPFAAVKKAVDFDISRIVGCLVSHEHNDHAGYVQSFLEARVPVCATRGTAGMLAIKSANFLRYLREAGAVRLGGFDVMAFDVQHDATEPVGFIIRHEETGNVLFATDTYYLRYRFTELSNILIECNYSLDILNENTRQGIVSMEQRGRTIKSHMSYRTCRDALRSNDLRKVNNIVLIHMSDNNCNAQESQRGIQRATGKTVHIAQKGLTIINFNKTPF